MSLDVFEIGNFPTDYIEVSADTTFEMAEAIQLFDDPYQIWTEVFSFELPEVDFALADYVFDEEYAYVLADTLKPLVLLSDYPLSETLFSEDLYEDIGKQFIGRWDEKDLDENYTFVMLLWMLKITEDFPIVFYEYPLAQSEYFDFDNNVYRYTRTEDDFSFELPTIYFLKPSYEEEFGDLPFKLIASEEYPELVHDWWISADEPMLDDLVPITQLSVVNDTFIDSSLNIDKWVKTPSTYGTISNYNNALRFDVIRNAITSQYPNIKSTYKVSDNFDIQIDFSELYPGNVWNNGLEIKVVADDGNSAYVRAGFSSGYPSFNAFEFGANNSSGASIGFQRVSRANNYGRLRISRTLAGVLSFLYQDGNGSWATLTNSIAWSTTPVAIYIGFNVYYWNGATLTAVVDNFTATLGIIYYSALDSYRLRNTLVDTEPFPSMLSLYNLVDEYYVEPNPVTEWAAFLAYDEFYIIPPIYQYKFLSFTQDMETFDTTVFNLKQDDYFDIPTSYLLHYEEGFELPSIFNSKSEDAFELRIPKIYTENKWVRKLPIENFRVNRVVDPFIDWNQLNFNTWFDFEDFDCRVFKVDTVCPVRVEEGFDISVEFNINFVLNKGDSFEFTDYGTFGFELSLYDGFYAFEIWATQLQELFEFNPSGFAILPSDTAPWELMVPTLYWDFLPPTVDSFNTPVREFYLEHTSEFYSFPVTPISFRLFLEDDIEDVLINLPEDSITATTELPVKLNNKLIGYTYRGYGCMTGYLYLDYEVQPAITMTDRLAILETQEYRLVDIDEFEVFSVEDSLLCDIEYVLHKIPQVGMNGEDRIYVFDDCGHRSNYNITH